MLIYIVRHSETKANVEGYFQGWSNDPLNENGIKLAEITGQNMRNIIFDGCISSPLSRAVETAEILLKESNNDVNIQFDDRIKEINCGDYEGRKIKMDEVQQFFRNPIQCQKFPNGENVLMVMKRTQDFFQELISRNNDKTYLVVTHGCALRAMLNFLYCDKKDFWHGHVPYNCCVNIVETKNGNARLIADDMVYYSSDLIVDRYERGNKAHTIRFNDKNK